MERPRYQDAKMRVAGDPTATRYLDKSLACLKVEPFFAQCQVALFDHPHLTRELKLLERRPCAGGRTLVDHPTGGHDDYANALALVMVLVARQHVRPWAASHFSHLSIGSPRDSGFPVGGGLGRPGVVSHLGGLHRGRR